MKQDETVTHMYTTSKIIGQLRMESTRYYPQSTMIQMDKSNNIALHIHIHYPELIQEIIEGIKLNKYRPSVLLLSAKRI